MAIFQLRFHGRGGQGVVTAAEMLSVAAFLEGKHAQAFPSFGSERMGAPVMSFCRISEKAIRSRDPVLDPDAMVVQDPTLLQSPGLFQGIKTDGFVLINSGREAEDLGIGEIIGKLPHGNILTVPATEIAVKHIKRPFPNTAMLGGLAAMTGIIKLDSVIKAINEHFVGAVAQVNAAAATEAYAFIMKKRQAVCHFEYREAVAC